MCCRFHVVVDESLLLRVKTCFFSYAAGSDFDAVAATVMFPVNSENGQRSCFEVTILNDMAFEKNQSFILNITAVEDNVQVHLRYITVNIVDNDSKFLLVVQPFVIREVSRVLDSLTALLHLLPW